MSKVLIKQAGRQMNTVSKIVQQIRNQLKQTASMLSEYPVVMAMNGVGVALRFPLNSWL
jgi:transposase